MSLLTLRPKPSPILTCRCLCRRWGALTEVLQFEVSGRCGTNDEFTSVIRYLKMHVYADSDMPLVLRNDVVFAWVLTSPAHAQSPHLHTHRSLLRAETRAGLALLLSGVAN